MNKNKLLDEYFNVIIEEGLSSRSRASKGNLMFYLNYLFKDISFIKKIMLDVGSGFGLYSFYAACSGAKQVICLEPELAGRTKNTFEGYKKLSDKLSLSNVSFLPIRFQDFNTYDEFDIILLHNSINHLDEEACIKLQYNDDARKRYESIFQKLSKLARQGAKLIIADCSRYNFFNFWGIKNPFAPTIEWHKHQSPKYWSNMLFNYGFANPMIRWTSPSFLRQIGRLLLGNRFASYFLDSHFCLIMDKRGKR